MTPSSKTTYNIATRTLATTVKIHSFPAPQWPLPSPSVQPHPLPSHLPLHLILGNHQYVLLFYNFVNSRMLHKWNHTACNILEVDFSTQHNSLVICLGHCVSQQFVLFYCWVELQGMDVPQLFNRSSVKGHLVVSGFLLLPINLL